MYYISVDIMPKKDNEECAHSHRVTLEYDGTLD